MSESWRRKRYYDKRILVFTERVVSSELPDSLICLSGPQVEMLRNITGYLRRRSTFAEGYTDEYYLAPTNEDWDTIDAIVSDLEEKLMGCQIDELITAIQAQTDVLDVLRQCVCSMSAAVEKQVAELPDMTGYVDETLVTYQPPGGAMATFTPPATDVVRCEYAQSIYLWVYQLYTEQLLPWAESTADQLTAVIVASTAFSALAGWIGIPVAVISTIVLAIVAWGVGGSVENFVNWLWGKKDEIVCILYNSLPDTSLAAAQMKSYIDSDTELSYLDKQLLKTVLASAWHYSWIIKDQEVNGTWDEYFVTGQCDECVETPAGCAQFYECNLAHWDGGVVECVSGLATIKGSTSLHTASQLFCPANSYLWVYWLPLAEQPGSAAASFGVERMADNVRFNIVTTGSFPTGTPVMSYGVIPSQCWLNDLQFTMKQETNWAAPIYWCIQDAPPT